MSFKSLLNVTLLLICLCGALSRKRFPAAGSRARDELENEERNAICCAKNMKCCRSTPEEPNIEIRAVMVRCPSSNEESGGRNLKTSLDANREENIKKYPGYDDDEPLSETHVKNCNRKLIITMRIDNKGHISKKSQFVIIDHVFDPITDKSQRLLNPYVIKLRQEHVTQMYGLKFLNYVNSEAKEVIYNKHQANYTGCNTSRNNPTCGIVTYNDKIIPFSEGFCCSCDSLINIKRQPKTVAASKEPIVSYTDPAMVMNRVSSCHLAKTAEEQQREDEENAQINKGQHEEHANVESMTLELSSSKPSATNSETFNQAQGEPNENTSMSEAMLEPPKRRAKKLYKHHQEQDVNKNKVKLHKSHEKKENIKHNQRAEKNKNKKRKKKKQKPFSFEEAKKQINDLQNEDAVQNVLNPDFKFKQKYERLKNEETVFFSSTAAIPRLNNVVKSKSRGLDEDNQQFSPVGTNENTEVDAQKGVKFDSQEEQKPLEPFQRNQKASDESEILPVGDKAGNEENVVVAENTQAGEKMQDDGKKLLLEAEDGNEEKVQSESVENVRYGAVQGGNKGEPHQERILEEENVDDTSGLVQHQDADKEKIQFKVNARVEENRFVDPSKPNEPIGDVYENAKAQNNDFPAEIPEYRNERKDNKHHWNYQQQQEQYQDDLNDKSEREMTRLKRSAMLRHMDRPEDIFKLTKRQISSGGSQIRGGQSCANRYTPPGFHSDSYHESTHCLRFSEVWYAVYELQEPIVEHSMKIQIFEKHEDAHGKTVWRDITQGKTAHLGSLTPNYEDAAGSLSIIYNSKYMKPEESMYALNYKAARLLVPEGIDKANVHKYPEVRGGPKEYLIVHPDLISVEGDKCNVAGVGFEAFYKQPNRCGVPKSSCLANQPRSLWKHDHKAEKLKRKGCFFLNHYGMLPENPIRKNGTDQLYLSLEYSGTYSSMIDMEIAADSNAALRPSSTAVITEVYVDSTSLTKTFLTIKITNGGLISSNFYTKLSDCPLDLPPSFNNIESKKVLIAPQHQHVFTLELRGRLTSDIFHCSVEALNGNGELVALRRIKIQKSDRCICTWHCLCACIGSTDGLKCKPMSVEQYHAAGFQGSLPIATSIVANRVVSDILEMLTFILIFMLLTLLFLGLTKALIGICCCPPMGMWGLCLLLDLPKRMNRYYEPELQKFEVEYDADEWPIHPVNRKRVRNISRSLEFCTNVFFFFTYPMVVLILLSKRLCCPYYTFENVDCQGDEPDNEEERSKAETVPPSEVSSKPAPPEYGEQEMSKFGGTPPETTVRKRSRSKPSTRSVRTKTRSTPATSRSKRSPTSSENAADA